MNCMPFRIGPVQNVRLNLVFFGVFRPNVYCVGNKNKQ